MTFSSRGVTSVRPFHSELVLLGGRGGFFIHPSGYERKRVNHLKPGHAAVSSMFPLKLMFLLQMLQADLLSVGHLLYDNVVFFCFNSFFLDFLEVGRNERDDRF